MPMPAAPGGSPGMPPTFLPAQKSKKELHSDYVEVMKADGREHIRSYRTWLDIWSSCCPHIKFMGLKTDMCDECDQHRQAVTEAITEEEKEESLAAYQEHLRIARTKRDIYNQRIKAAGDELKEHGVEYSTDVPEGTVLESQHWSFDFAQSIQFPHRTQQISVLYFTRLMQVGLFGICDDGTGIQDNFIFDEGQTIGPDGSTSHGPDTVCSCLYHKIKDKAAVIKKLSFHADNCPGQNKHQTMMHFLMWLIATGQLDYVELEFMEKGHTKCQCDRCFGLGKKALRRHDFDSMQQIGDIINKSSKYNKVQHVVDPSSGQQIVTWYSWKQFFKPSLKPLKGISRHAKFRFSKDHIGM